MQNHSIQISFDILTQNTRFSFEEKKKYIYTGKERMLLDSIFSCPHKVFKTPFLS